MTRSRQIEQKARDDPIHALCDTGRNQFLVNAGLHDIQWLSDDSCCPGCWCWTLCVWKRSIECESIGTMPLISFDSIALSVYLRGFFTSYKSTNDSSSRNGCFIT